jgi:hypothetical protein
MLAHSSVHGQCANYLTKQLFWQELFPDSLLQLLRSMMVELSEHIEQVLPVIPSNEEEDHGTSQA